MDNQIYLPYTFWFNSDTNLAYPQFYIPNIENINISKPDDFSISEQILEENVDGTESQEDLLYK